MEWRSSLLEKILRKGELYIYVILSWAVPIFVEMREMRQGKGIGEESWGVRRGRREESGGGGDERCR